MFGLDVLTLVPPPLRGGRTVLSAERAKAVRVGGIVGGPSQARPPTRSFSAFGLERSTAPQWGRYQSAVFAFVALAGVAHADESVGLWVKNTSSMPVTVTVDGAPACQLEAPVNGECAPKVDKKTAHTIKKYSEKKTCTVNSLKISCITNIPAAGADVSLRRSDGLEYKLRAAKGGTLYLCVDASALTDCFGKKIQ